MGFDIPDRVYHEENTLAVLDHGFVKLRNLAGPTRRTFNMTDDSLSSRAFDADDTDVANAARLSFEGQDQDRTYEVEMKLNRYLLQNQHMTPFEAIHVWLEMKMPIFVARQFVRHRTQSIDEASARYIQLPSDWYIPKLEDVLFQADKKKQGGRPIDLSSPDEVRQAEVFRTTLNYACASSYEMYEEAIKHGIAMEQARCFLHLNHYTHWMTNMNLRNLMHFLALRDHPHAQREAQAYAKAITQLIEPHLPGLMQLYRELVKGE